jgi:cell wall-associated NlpC family hydrolase
VTARRTSKAVALCAAALITLALTPVAHADDDHTKIPTQSDVDEAQQNVFTAQRSVAAIRAELAAASQRLDALNIAAEQAAEAYNGAVVAWQQAEADAKAARQRAARAEARSGDARNLLAGYVLSQSNSAPELTAIGQTLSASGAHGLIAQLADAETSARALDAQFQSWAAANELAKVYQKAAEDALAKASEAKQAAADARQAAQAAVDAQQAAVANINVQRDALVRELAEAQNISIQLAAKRQAGLEARRRAQAADRRREAQSEREHQPRHHHSQHHGGTSGGSGPSAPPPPPPLPPPPTDPHPPKPTKAAEVAIAFAYDQLGEPYVWGAAGPDSWDCSGLTMGAWAAAGVQLSHYSVSQYYETDPISYSKIRPGDLIFWATDPNDPTTIFHVALYIGDGQMIQAPRTGRNVEIQDVWYWEAPDFFTRVVG